MKYCVGINHVCRYKFCVEHSVALHMMAIVRVFEFVSSRAWGSVIMGIKPVSRRRLLALRGINCCVFSIWKNEL